MPISNKKVYEPAAHTLLSIPFYALIAPLFIVSIMIVLERRIIAKDKARYARDQT